MKTEISEFCGKYTETLKPLSGTLEEAIQRIEHDSLDGLLRVPLAGLSDVKHRLKTLADKVENQQAFLLIFGPLKSGKSTLMNALSGAYVSEVTSMPAYPCLVFVSHADRQNVTVTRYNGRKEHYPDTGALQTIVSEAHASLAERIRQVESEGGSFDPGVHYPDAIRRVDIQLPVPNLEESSTVLVDTPGLYSRMKFGYDLMTREFRNSAACAVFVVKTDNLFLEQVFVEFTELLSLFSRIFLIVNIDTRKQDLLPDGNFRPSMESQSPERIVEAFESLTMDAPLRQAFEEGRLKIYPIDLMSSASAFLRGEAVEEDQGHNQDQDNATAESSDRVTSIEAADVEDETETDPYADTATETEAEEDEEIETDADDAEEHEESRTAIDAGVNGEMHPKPEAAAEHPDRRHYYDQFVNDLTNYLNSSDYLIEFMRDSLRQGSTLCDEILKQHTESALNDLSTQHERLSKELNEVSSSLQAAKALQSADWKAAFKGVKDQTAKKASELANESVTQLTDSLMESLDQWFRCNESLKTLEESRWNPTLKETGSSLSSEIRSRVDSLLNTSMGGADLQGDLVRHLDRLNLSLAAIYKDAVGTMKNADTPKDCSIAVKPELIPVRKKFLDRILFRSRPAVRRRVFGEQLNLHITPEVKKKRLEPDGREALSKMAKYHVEQHFAQSPQQHAQKLLQAYMDDFCNRVLRHLDATKQDLEGKRKSLQDQLDANQRIASSLKDLSGRAENIVESIQTLSHEFHCEPQQTPAEESEEVGLQGSDTGDAPETDLSSETRASDSGDEVSRQDPESGQGPAIRINY